MFQTVIIIAVLLAADQAIKIWAERVLSAMPFMDLLPGLVELTYVRNTGAAFSFGSGKTLFFIIFTTVMLVVLLVIETRIKKRKIRLLDVSLTLIIAGGIGNLIDRVARGYVVDMFNFRFMDFPVFNFADILITVGTGLLFIFILFYYDKYFPSQKKQKEGEADGSDT